MCSPICRANIVHLVEASRHPDGAEAGEAPPPVEVERQARERSASSAPS